MLLRDVVISRDVPVTSSDLLESLHHSARGAAAKTYLPIVASTNILYLFLRLVYYKSSLTTYHITMAILLIAISSLAYKGILDDHANSSGSKGEALAGGLSLDLLGLAVLVQFGSLASDYFYWLLVSIPVVGMYKLYGAFKGGKDAVGGFMPNDSDDNRGKVESEEAKAKRQRRAERRRQKWN